MWLDVARGACVIAVVLLHVRIFVHEPLSPAGLAPDGWREFTEFFGPFRLPLLFTISGLLVSERVRAGWGDRRNVVRVASSYWLYLVWLTLFAVMSVLVTATGVPFKIESPADFAQQLAVPDTPLWFVFALALYVLVLTSLQRLPRAAVLGMFLALAVVSGLAPASEAEAQWLHIVYFGAFFTAGVYLPAVLVWFSGGRVVPKLLGTLAAFVLLQQLWQLTEIGDMLETSARLLRDAAAVTLAIVVCALVSRIPAVARVFALVGRQTLPVYILQLPLIWALFLLPVVPGLYESPAARAIGPVVATGLIVAVAILAHHGLQRTPLRFLFGLPSAVRDRIVRGQAA